MWRAIVAMSESDRAAIIGSLAIVLAAIVTTGGTLAVAIKRRVGTPNGHGNVVQMLEHSLFELGALHARVEGVEVRLQEHAELDQTVQAAIYSALEDLK